jgi:D-alanine--poly(phosphoribitol) ligase subunit 1
MILDKGFKKDSLISLLFKSYDESRFHAAIRINNESMTYDELYHKALQLAAILKKNDAFDETVAIVGHRNFSTYIGILAVLFAGCNYTPINPKVAKSKILEILTDSRVNYLVGDNVSVSLLHDHLKSNDLVGKSIITPLCCVKDRERHRWMDKTEVDKIDPLLHPVDSDDSHLAYVLYTSGSTGKPKGVQVTRGNLFSYLKAVDQLWDLPTGFRMSQFHDLSFDPSVSDIFYTFCNKGTLCVVPEKEIMLPSDFIIREKLNVWSSVPSIGLFMSKMGALVHEKYPDLKIVRHAGEPFPVALAESWKSAAPNASIENHYGPTEATIDVSRYTYDPDDDCTIYNNSIMPIGNSFPNMKIAIVNNELEEILEKNKRGEIVYCGPQITNGYLNDTLKTESAFVNFKWDIEGRTWYRSGDIGFYNINGDIECVGRIDNQIKLGGRRIELGEIEVALMKSNQINDIIVVPVRNFDKSTKHLVAFTTNSVSKESWSSLTKSSNIESIFIPKKLFKIDRFPINTSGKLNRKELEELADNLSSSKKQ